MSERRHPSKYLCLQHNTATSRQSPSHPAVHPYSLSHKINDFMLTPKSAIISSIYTMNYVQHLARLPAFSLPISLLLFSQGKGTHRQKRHGYIVIKNSHTMQCSLQNKQDHPNKYFYTLILLHGYLRIRRQHTHLDPKHHYL